MQTLEIITPLSSWNINILLCRNQVCRLFLQKALIRRLPFKVLVLIGTLVICSADRVPDKPVTTICHHKVTFLE